MADKSYKWIDADGKVHQYEGFADFFARIRRGRMVEKDEILVGVNVEDFVEWYIIDRDNVKTAMENLKQFFADKGEHWTFYQLYNVGSNTVRNGQ